MAALQEQTTWLDGSLSIFRALSTGHLALVLRNALDIWEIVRQWRERVGYHGMYKILDYEATLELVDPSGERAKLARHEVIRFLQDNIVAIHDHAWGDGDLFADYQCQPGQAVDVYQDGSKHNILISLRETKNRGDVLDLRLKREINRGFLEQDEWLETEIDHWLEHLKLSVIFPKERPCRRATVTQRSSNKMVTLDRHYFSILSDGRQILTWETKRPRLHDLYTIKWRW